MNAAIQVPEEWRDWIAHNIARGCDLEVMIADMMRAGFAADAARSAVFGLSGRDAATASAANGVYVYETPRLPAGNLIRTPNRDVRITLRIERPTVAFVDNLFDAQECDELVRLSAHKLVRSTIVDRERGSAEVIAGRTSEGTYFPLNADAFIARLDRRIAALMNMPIENGEGLQILHYRTGGEYTPHYDYFPPEDAGSHAHLAQGGQRVASLVIYLNDVEDGGATVFPKLGLTVGPKKGAAVYFEYCNSLGQVDPQTLHGGLPVLRGEKWIATKWMRQRRYGG
ncbi:MAG: 2OG-Fe(II) oxygenase [Rudaea sp.]|uniref:2OG-Fe(II) oxygenase n=1 Tax=unclassified Rudaea TaxID=2627037 RepID=UPI0010F95958|nr:MULTISPECIES: 2OG-Fe(II) oxygenase [unclassified Rudaea]MBN8886044.1 2OG-Fe(II) oxygenase [Rudaea sp.]MBR0345137.1 2OG-Fe(II) oxygenase [Rudaea sp.]